VCVCVCVCVCVHVFVNTVSYKLLVAMKFTTWVVLGTKITF